MNRYATPALEKGLDILELLAGMSRPVNHSEIAEALGRSKSELFRMLVTLTERGYLERDPTNDAFVLSDRLFRLGLKVPRVRSLLDCALPRLNALAERIGQSPHLVVVRDGRTAVIASCAGGSDNAFTLRLGFGRIAADSTSGQVIMAFQEENHRDAMLRESLALREEAPVDAELTFEDVLASLDRIRANGFERHESRDFLGISDLCCPILDNTGHAIASVVISFVNRRGKVNAHEDALARLIDCCRAISREMGAPIPPDPART